MVTFKKYDISRRQGNVKAVHGFCCDQQKAEWFEELCIRRNPSWVLSLFLFLCFFFIFRSALNLFCVHTYVSSKCYGVGHKNSGQPNRSQDEKGAGRRPSPIARPLLGMGYHLSHPCAYNGNLTRSLPKQIHTRVHILVSPPNEKVSCRVKHCAWERRNEKREERGIPSRRKRTNTKRASRDRPETRNWQDTDNCKKMSSAASTLCVLVVQIACVIPLLLKPTFQGCWRFLELFVRVSLRWKITASAWMLTAL